MFNAMKRFLSRDFAPSVVFLAMMVLAVICVNTSLKPYFETLHTTSATIVINDLLMALFFLTIGIEIKQEIRKDSASALSRLLLPLVAAIAGIALPAGIYAYVNWGSNAMPGWAIPTATDI